MSSFFWVLSKTRYQHSFDQIKIVFNVQCNSFLKCLSFFFVACFASHRGSFIFEMIDSNILHCAAEFFYVTIASLVDNGVQAPLFLQEPISELVFSNESGSRISCTAHGTPAPTVTWVQKDGSPISSVLGLRYNLTHSKSIRV